MPLELIPSFLFYCFIGSITPGPANLCSFAAAIRYGRKQALKQWRGLFVGFATVSLIAAFIAYFVGSAFYKYVWILSVIGFFYIMWLAYNMLNMQIKETDEVPDCSFKNGYFVQLSNVKIMIYCISVQGIYVLPYDNTFTSVLLMALFLPFTGPIANLVWLFTGSLLKSEYEKHQRAWNWGMAISLALCAVNILLV